MFSFCDSFNKHVRRYFNLADSSLTGFQKLIKLIYILKYDANYWWLWQLWLRKDKEARSRMAPLTAKNVVFFDVK